MPLSEGWTPPTTVGGREPTVPFGLLGGKNRRLGAYPPYSELIGMREPSPAHKLAATLPPGRSWHGVARVVLSN